MTQETTPSTAENPRNYRAGQRVRVSAAGHVNRLQPREGEVIRQRSGGRVLVRWDGNCTPTSVSANFLELADA